jgi:hypothetical protein
MSPAAARSTAGIVLVLVIGGSAWIVAGQARPRATEVSRSGCPQRLAATASARAPVAEAVGAMQMHLSRLTINSQGRIYRLTPHNAPIDFVAQLGTVGSRTIDQRIPGLLTLHRAAAIACGEHTAQASWAFHYTISVAIIAGLGGYEFAAKTRTGWRFWGTWCGAGASAAWRQANCP